MFLCLEWIKTIVFYSILLICSYFRCQLFVLLWSRVQLNTAITFCLMKCLFPYQNLPVIACAKNNTAVNKTIISWLDLMFGRNGMKWSVTFLSGGSIGLQLLALSWWSSSNLRLIFSIDSWSISQKPARSEATGRGCALGFYKKMAPTKRLQIQT